MPVSCFGGQVYTERCDVIREDDVTRGVRLHLLAASEWTDGPRGCGWRRCAVMVLDSIACSKVTVHVFERQVFGFQLSYDLIYQKGGQVLSVIYEPVCPRIVLGIFNYELFGMIRLLQHIRTSVIPQPSYVRLYVCCSPTVPESHPRTCRPSPLRARLAGRRHAPGRGERAHAAGARGQVRGLVSGRGHAARRPHQGVLQVRGQDEDPQPVRAQAGRLETLRLLLQLLHAGHCKLAPGVLAGRLEKYLSQS